MMEELIAWRQARLARYPGDKSLSEALALEMAFYSAGCDAMIRLAMASDAKLAQLCEALQLKPTSAERCDTFSALHEWVYRD